GGIAERSYSRAEGASRGSGGCGGGAGSGGSGASQIRHSGLGGTVRGSGSRPSGSTFSRTIARGRSIGRFSPLLLALDAGCRGSPALRARGRTRRHRPDLGGVASLSLPASPGFGPSGNDQRL